MEQQKGSARQRLTSSAAFALLIILGALVGGFLVISKTSDANGSAEAVATIVATVVGVAGTHIGHVTAHQRQERGWRPREGVAVGIAVAIATALAVLFAAIFASANDMLQLSPEAIAALGAAVIGVAGTHLGHVAGHRLAKEEAVRPEGQGVKQAESDQT